MSLWVYLEGESQQVSCECPHCFNEHTRIDSEEYFSANITHNLNKMADEAGIYKHVWRPEEVDIVCARQLIEPLRTGLALMKADPPRFEKHNAQNGWGLYEHFVPWLEKYLAACEEYPDARVRASR